MREVITSLLAMSHTSKNHISLRYACHDSVRERTIVRAGHFEQEAELELGVWLVEREAILPQDTQEEQGQA